MGEIVKLEPATLVVADEMAPLLRQKDLDEIQASSGRSGLEALRFSIEASWLCVVARFHGEAGAIFGLAATTSPKTILGLSPFGLCWFLTARACDAHPLVLGRTAKRVIRRLHEISGCVEIGNWIDARYTEAVKLAEFCGFKIRATMAHGLEGLPFHFASRRWTHG